MQSLIPVEIHSEFSVDATGQTTASIIGVARLLDLSDSTLVEAFDPSRFNKNKLAQKLIESGFDPSRFPSDGVPDTAFAVICEYYAFDAGARCKPNAKLIYRAFASVGIRTWIQKELGWVESSAIAKVNPETQVVIDKLQSVADAINALAQAQSGSASLIAQDAKKQLEAFDKERAADWKRKSERKEVERWLRRVK